MRYLLLIAAIIYILWPYDILADLLPGWGWIDDLLIAYLVWRFGFTRARRHDRRKSRPGSDSRQEEKETEPDPEAAQLPDPYQVLNVPRDAPLEEINRAYRKLAAKYHPDKVTHLGEEFRELAEIRFKEIQTAHDRLRQRHGLGK